MPDTSVIRQQANFDDVDLQLAVRSMTADNRAQFSDTVPLPVEHAEGHDRPHSIDHRGWRGLILPGGVLGLGAALLLVAVVSVSHQPAPPPPIAAIPAGSFPVHTAPVPVAPPVTSIAVVAPPVVESPVVAPPVDSAPTVGMPQQRLRHLLTRLADRR